MSGKKAPGNQGHKHAHDTRVWRVFFRTSPHDRQSHDMRPPFKGTRKESLFRVLAFLTLWERIIIIIINYNNKILFEDDLAISSAHPVLKGTSGDLQRTQSSLNPKAETPKAPETNEENRNQGHFGTKCRRHGYEREKGARQSRAQACTWHPCVEGRFDTSPHDRQSHDMRPPFKGTRKESLFRVLAFLTLWERIIIIIINYNNKILFEDDLAISSAHPVLKGTTGDLQRTQSSLNPKAETPKAPETNEENRNQGHFGTKCRRHGYERETRRPAIKGTSMHMIPVMWRVFFRTSPHDRQSHDMRPAFKGTRKESLFRVLAFLTLWERIIIIIIYYNIRYYLKAI